MPIIFASSMKFANVYASTAMRSPARNSAHRVTTSAFCTPDVTTTQSGSRRRPFHASHRRPASRWCGKPQGFE